MIMPILEPSTDTRDMECADWSKRGSCKYSGPISVIDQVWVTWYKVDSP